MPDSSLEKQRDLDPVADNRSNLNRKPRLRVLQIIGAPEMGGIEIQLLHFLRRYNRDKMVLDVACTDTIDGLLRDEYVSTGTRLYSCRWSPYLFPFIWRLRLFLKQHAYDVVHARLSEVSGAAMLASFAAGVPHRIASYHHTRTRWRRPGVDKRLAAKCLQGLTRHLARTILSVSESCLDMYHPEWRRCPGKFRICHNGVDPELFHIQPDPALRARLDLPGDAFVVGHVGSFREAKNHRTIVEVAALLCRNVPGVHFLLVGDGPLRERIEKDVYERGLSGHFRFTGNRQDVPQLMAAMDVFLLPSLSEGFATVAAEAQLSGLPVVAANLECMREILCPEMRLFCREPRDSGGMSEQILNLHANVGLRKAVGGKGREYVKNHFSVDGMVRRLESIYESQAG